MKVKVWLMFLLVVFITSNYIGNSEIMQGCKEAGIPCFGTLWDFVSVFLFFSDGAISNGCNSEMALAFHCSHSHI